MSINLMSAIFRTEFRDLQDAEGNTTKASTAKFICIALADHANDEGEGAYPSIGKLAYKTNLSRTAIINALDALKHNGILTAEGKSKWDTVNYTVNNSCFSKDSQPSLLVNPLDSPSQPALLEGVNPLDPNHPITILEPSLQENFENLKTDEETPPYNLEEADIAWTIAAGKEVTQSLAYKQADTYKFEEMICAQLARLPYNFEGDKTQEQDNFRKFLKAKRKLGQELETWVNWWMSDEYQVAHPPWNLTAVKTKWDRAFTKTEKKSSGRKFERLNG